MTARLQVMSYGLLLVCAFGAGVLVKGAFVDSKVAALNEQIATNNANALRRYQNMEKTKDEAISRYTKQAELDKASATAASASVERLRGELAKVPSRIATASRHAVDQYATTAGELLATCADEYRHMARIADGHANDARLLAESWPK